MSKTIKCEECGSWFGSPEADSDARPGNWCSQCCIDKRNERAERWGVVPVTAADANRIASLVAESSVGQGLANIERSGLAAELLQLDHELDAQPGGAWAPAYLREQYPGLHVRDYIHVDGPRYHVYDEELLVGKANTPDGAEIVIRNYVGSPADWKPRV